MDNSKKFKIISNEKNKYGLSVYDGIIFQGDEFWIDLFFDSEEDINNEIEKIKEEGYIEVK
jgi:hypothetical protein